MANAATLRLPAPVFDIIGWESNAAVTGSVNFTLPVFALACGNIAGTSLVLPTPQLAIAGLTGNVTTVLQTPLSLPAPTISIVGTPGVIGGVSFTRPMLVLVVGGSDRTTLAMPAPQLQLVGTTGIVGGVTLQLPAPQLRIVGAVPFVAGVALGLRPQLSIAGVTGSAGAVDLTLRRLALAAAGHTGVVGGVTLTLPLMQIGAAGHEEAVGSVALTLPMLRLLATGRTGEAGVSAAYAMHLEGQQLTEYTNFGFNSLTQFNGVYLGATDDGIFALAGADDAGVAIDAVARVGTSDFGTSLIKRITRAYVGYKTSGQMELRVITDEIHTRRYALANNTRTNLRGGRVQVGMGIEARYWQFEIANVAGADFTLDCIEITPTRMGRRVNGSGG